MTKAVFNELIDRCDEDTPVGIVLDAIKSCGGYSSCQSIIVTAVNDLYYCDDFIQVPVSRANAQSVFSVLNTSGTFLIPYSQIKMVISNFVSKKGD